MPDEQEAGPHPPSDTQQKPTIRTPAPTAGPVMGPAVPSGGSPWLNAMTSPPLHFGYRSVVVNERDAISGPAAGPRTPALLSELRGILQPEDCPRPPSLTPTGWTPP